MRDDYIFLYIICIDEESKNMPSTGGGQHFLKVSSLSTTPKSDCGTPYRGACTARLAAASHELDFTYIAGWQVLTSSCATSRSGLSLKFQPATSDNLITLASQGSPTTRFTNQPSPRVLVPVLCCQIAEPIFQVDHSQPVESTRDAASPCGNCSFPMET